jgi:hypothetical protein
MNAQTLPCSAVSGGAPWPLEWRVHLETSNMDAGAQREKKAWPETAEGAQYGSVLGGCSTVDLPPLQAALRDGAGVCAVPGQSHLLAAPREQSALVWYAASWLTTRVCCSQLLLVVDEAFIKYLAYLQYWRQPEYAKFVAYPYCFFFLEQLQSAEFREKLLLDPSFAAMVLKQTESHWRFFRLHRNAAAATDESSNSTGK